MGTRAVLFMEEAMPNMTSIENHVRYMYSALSKSEQIAANYFLSHPDHIFQYPLASLAEMSKTSQGAWVRFCKSIGFEGLKGLKNALFLEISQEKAETDSPKMQFLDIRQCSSIAITADQVCANSIQAIEATKNLLDEQLLEKLIPMIIGADTIGCFGIGASGLVAEDLYSKFLRLGYHVFYSDDIHVSYAFAATSSPLDIAFLFSNSGETREILRIAEILKKSGTATVAITRYNANNPLSQLADYVLYIDSTEILIRSGATSSRIAQLCVSDILFMAVAGRDYERIEKKLELSYEICHPDLS